jgi:SAM-dependent methyltransferase
MKPLDQDRLRRFYDRMGAGQDSQGFYEDPALDALVRAGEFGAAGSVLEIGCGTGKFAARLLREELPEGARYLGTDMSGRMVELARARIAPWAGRARVEASDGGFDPEAWDGPFDRVVLTYVFDLMDEDRIAAALGAIHGALAPGGRLCACGLTRGTGPVSRGASGLWSAIHRAAPYLVGGCRPLVLAELLPPRDWRVVHREVVVSWAIPSEVLVAEAT